MDRAVDALQWGAGTAARGELLAPSLDDAEGVRRDRDHDPRRVERTGHPLRAEGNRLGDGEDDLRPSAGVEARGLGGGGPRRRRAPETPLRVDDFPCYFR